MNYRLLVINPGSTSTKLAIFDDLEERLAENISHSPEELASFEGVIDQLDYRFEKVKDFLSRNRYSLDQFTAIAARGGLLRPIPSGTYRVNEEMTYDLRSERFGSHAANLGALIANRLVEETNIPAYIVDPVVVDELAPVARITGHPEMKRISIFHALNQKAVAKRLAKNLNTPYEKLNLIVAHMGGGISIGCHTNGKVVEVNNALNGEGPFSPERMGTVQSERFAELIREKNWTPAEVSKILAGKGGIYAHLGTTDVRDVEKLITEDNQTAKLVFDAMIYQISRAIGAAAVVVQGKVDHIILTGGIAHSKALTRKIEEAVRFIAPIVIMPGENELQALAEGVERVLSGQEEALEYRNS